MGRTSGRGARDAGTPRGVVTRRLRVLAAVLAFALLPLAGIGASANAAPLADYPTWPEVVAAQRNAAQAHQLAAQLEGQLAGLQAEAQRTQEEAQAKGEIWAKAQEAFDQQNIETQALLEQTAKAQAEADAAYLVAAQVIAQMSKSGTGDLAPRLLTTPSSPDLLLNRLELDRVIGQRYSELYDRAITLKNAAQALADQAKVAQQILDELRIAAEAAFLEAQAAAQAAAETLARTEREIAEVKARVEYLRGISTATTAAYNEGLRVMYGDGAEGEISASGWARPAGGYITSPYGNRYHPIHHQWILHSGVDLSGGGCGGTIRATHAGTVTYAGWNGGLGNYIQINHGDGTSSGYGHIVNGGIGVSIGQTVAPGQPIAKVGTTGTSTGCHLHFIIRVNGSTVNPVPFLRERGISLG